MQIPTLFTSPCRLQARRAVLPVRPLVAQTMPPLQRQPTPAKVVEE
jgi:hypothetical protein